MDCGSHHRRGLLHAEVLERRTWPSPGTQWVAEPHVAVEELEDAGAVSEPSAGGMQADPSQMPSRRPLQKEASCRGLALTVAMVIEMTAVGRRVLAMFVVGVATTVKVVVDTKSMVRSCMTSLDLIL